MKSFLFFALTACLVFSPLMIRGPKYVSRYWIGDSYVYWSMAKGLQDYGYQQELKWCPELYTDRGVFMAYLMLGFSRLTKINLQYSGGLLCLIAMTLLWIPAYLLARHWGLPEDWARWTAVAVAVGFWAQQLYDVDAYANIVAMPIGVTLVYAYLTRKNWLILAAAIGIYFVYVEMLLVLLFLSVIWKCYSHYCCYRQNLR